MVGLPDLKSAPCSPRPGDRGRPRNSTSRPIRCGQPRYRRPRSIRRATRRHFDHCKQSAVKPSDALQLRPESHVSGPAHDVVGSISQIMRELPQASAGRSVSRPPTPRWLRLIGRRAGVISYTSISCDQLIHAFDSQRQHFGRSFRRRTLIYSQTAAPPEFERPIHGPVVIH